MFERSQNVLKQLQCNQTKEIIDPLTVKASTPRGDENYESGSRRRRVEHAIFPFLHGVEALTSNGSIISLLHRNECGKTPNQ
jgi:hypothetical protein